MPPVTSWPFLSSTLPVPIAVPQSFSLVVISDESAAVLPSALNFKFLPILDASMFAFLLASVALTASFNCAIVAASESAAPSATLEMRRWTSLLPTDT